MAFQSGAKDRLVEHLYRSVNGSRLFRCGKHCDFYIVRSNGCHIHMPERSDDVILDFGRVVNHSCCSDIGRLH